jgi:phosphoribosyl 1,2-cyclic phosphodiesterase
MSTPTTRLSFWGVRGSTPTVDPATWRYGGNTPCLEVQAPDGTQFILDCGTGLRMLGNRWVGPHGTKAAEAHIFVTHYHWDHIQGIPFFAPLYAESNRFHFYSFRSRFLGPDSLKQVFETQMAHPYFPVDISAMSAARKFSEMSDGDQYEISATKVTARWLNHPQGCLGFRLETPAGSIVYATDNEPGVAKLDKSLLELAAGADILINDAQFSPEQLATTRKGWGHSSWLEGVKLAKEAGAKHLVLFHHDPDSSDKVVDETLRKARDNFESVYAALEGMVMTLGEERVEVILPGARTTTRRKAHFRARVAGFNEEGQAFQEDTVIGDLSLQSALIYLKHTPRLQSEVTVVMEPTGNEGHGEAAMNLRGYVVRIEPGPEKDLSAVGIVFTE